MAENFQFMARIGQGAFASVYKVMRKEDSNFYAFKKIKATNMKDKELSNCLNEVRILASVKNPFVIAYKEAFYESNLKSFCLITEFAEGGDLANKINRIKKGCDFFEEKYIWRMAIQLLHGIRALHALNIFHRDIKPANILLSKNDEIAKLGDMNVSIIAKTGLATTQTGTPYYASPQVWMQKPYNGKSDIWSLGCVLYEMAAQRPPFSGQDLPALKRKIISSECDKIPSIYSTDLDNFIKKCLIKDQKIRPDSNDLLESSLVKQKLKMFPNQKFSSQDVVNEPKNKMIQTIRFDNRNLKSLQTKLPKCAYDSNQKENVSKNILENSSWVHQKRNRQSLQKIPKQRAESAKRRLPALKIAKEEKPPLKKHIIKMR